MYDVPSSVHYLGSHPFLYLGLQICAQKIFTTYDREIRLIRSAAAPGSKQVQTTA